MSERVSRSIRESISIVERLPLRSDESRFSGELAGNFLKDPRMKSPIDNSYNGDDENRNYGERINKKPVRKLQLSRVLPALMRYPNPLTVSIIDPAAPSLLRSR